MEQANRVRKLQIVRALVRPDRRDDYIARWAAYRREAAVLDARAWLFEDEALPGRFVEFTEYFAAPGMAGRLKEAAARAGLAEVCARRTGADERYREARPADGGDGG